MGNQSNKKSFLLLKKISRKKIKGSILRYAITVFSCVLIIVMGAGILAYASATTIGENIITNILTATGLTVSGNATTTGNQIVSGNLEVGGNATTTGNQIVSGNLTVSGTTALATTTMATTTISGDLTVSGVSTFSSNVSIDGDTELSSINGNTKYVKSDETIQSVIDSCPVAIGSLKEGFTNPYVIKVPTGHEKEYYSLVRNAGDVASDKRNVKVIFEDNPDGKFIVKTLDSCDNLDYIFAYGETEITLDTDHNFEGSSCVKMVKEGPDGHIGLEYSRDPHIDIRQYQGFLVDVDISFDEVKYLHFYLYDSNTHREQGIAFSSAKDRGRVTMFCSFGTQKSSSDLDYSDIRSLKFIFLRETGYTGNITIYMDNFRLVRTTPHNTAILRFDDACNEHWSIVAKALDARGWKGAFSTTYAQKIVEDKAFVMSLEQIQNMNKNGHDIINHATTHFSSPNTSKVDTYQYIKQMRKFLEHYGVNRASHLYINPGHGFSKHVQNCLEEMGCLSMSPAFNYFPADYTDCGGPSGLIPTYVQNLLGNGIGGITQLMVHTVTNEADFIAFLDWVEESFSEIILPTEVVNRFPIEYAIVPKNNYNTGWQETLDATFPLHFWHGDVISLDSGGASRNVIPVFEFHPSHRLELINTADADENLTFDPTFTSAGNHDGSNNASVLTDSGESWTVGQLVGRTISNTPDGSSGVITANTATTITAVLSGGISDDWQTGEAYTITPVGLNQTVGQDQRATFVYDGEGWDIINLYDKIP